MEKVVNLIENFVSWQGEGPDSGQSMIILRFKTCNLKCPWCDTSVKMRISAEAPHRLKDIQKSIYDRRAGILVTGGEPTVSRHINEAAMLLNELDYPVANVESNGHRLEELIKMTDSSKNVRFMYSPKIFSSKDLESAIEKTSTLLSYPNLFIKVVYEENEYVIQYLEWLSEQITSDTANKVWVMPEGVTRADLIRNSEKVFDACEKFKFNFSSRNHLIFGFV